MKRTSRYLVLCTVAALSASLCVGASAAEGENQYPQNAQFQEMMAAYSRVDDAGLFREELQAACPLTGTYDVFASPDSPAMRVLTQSVDFLTLELNTGADADTVSAVLDATLPQCAGEYVADAPYRTIRATCSDAEASLADFETIARALSEAGVLRLARANTHCVEELDVVSDTLCFATEYQTALTELAAAQQLNYMVQSVSDAETGESWCRMLPAVGEAFSAVDRLQLAILVRDTIGCAPLLPGVSSGLGERYLYDRDTTTLYNAYGDVNCNGSVEISDAIMLARYIAEDQTLQLTEEGTRRLDCDGTSGVTSQDLTWLLQRIAKLPVR